MDFKFKYAPNNTIVRNIPTTKIITEIIDGEEVEKEVPDSVVEITSFKNFMGEHENFPIIEGDFFEYMLNGELQSTAIMNGVEVGITCDASKYRDLIEAIEVL